MAQHTHEIHIDICETIMIRLNKILVATDFSDHSAVALKYAEEFARAFSAEVILLNVVEESGILSQIPPGGEAYFPPNMDETRKENAEAQCAELLASTSIEKQSARVVIGKPFLEIVQTARSEDVDLIIVGTHGRGVIAHVLLGSVAEKVVRKAPCPVLTVREGEHEFVMP